MPIVELYGDADNESFEETELDVIADDYLAVLQDLLPPGPAWTRRDDATLTKLLRAIGYEALRVERAAQQLLSEAIPSETQELLDDWEAFLALPELCGEAPTELADRQAALVAKLRQRLSPKPSTFIAIAEALGYSAVSVRLEGNPFTCISNCNATLRGAYWIYTWTLVVDDHNANDGTLECIARRLSPQHTTMLIEYTADL